MTMMTTKMNKVDQDKSINIHTMWKRITNYLDKDYHDDDDDNEEKGPWTG